MDDDAVAGDGQLAYQRSLPAKRMGAGLLVRDADGRVLLVEPAYKPDWEIPGGVVEEDESPRDCVVREVREELGLDVMPDRLLAVDYQRGGQERTESLMFVFDGGRLSEAAATGITLPADELRSWRFVAAEALDGLVSPRLARRLRWALAGVGGDGPAYLEHGRPPTGR